MVSDDLAEYDEEYEREHEPVPLLEDQTEDLREGRSCALVRTSWLVVDSSIGKR